MPVLGRIFHPENRFFQITARLVDLVLLSLLWLVASLPLVTLGPASAALYDTVVKTFRTKEETTPYRRFLQVFRRELRVGIPASLIVLAIGFLMYCLYVFFLLSAPASPMWYTLFFTFLVVLLLLIGIVSYLFPVLSRFTFGVGGLIGTCIKLALAHLPVTACLAIVTAAGAWVCLRYWWPVLFVPGVLALLASQPLERIFQPYVDQQRSAGEAPPED